MEYSFFEIVGVLFISFIGLMLPFLVLRIADKISEKRERKQYIDEQLDKIDYLISKVDYLSEVFNKNGKRKI